MKITATAVLNLKRPYVSSLFTSKLRIAAGYLLRERPACV